MQALNTVLAELLGLFVDDGSLVAAVIVWVGACALGLWAQLIAPAMGGVLLGAGIAALLAENVLRSARRRGR